MVFILWQGMFSTFPATGHTAILFSRNRYFQERKKSFFFSFQVPSDLFQSSSHFLCQLLINLNYIPKLFFTCETFTFFFPISFALIWISSFQKERDN